MLCVRGLRIERDGVILQGVDWCVEAGEHWVVLGANGSGKTSLLNALTGYLVPSAGSIEVLGERFGEFDWRKLRQRIGIVSASLGQRIEGLATALEVVASGLNASLNFHRRLTRPARAAALQMLERMESFALRDRSWAVLSQGERQRILVGRALMAQPRLLILDEPCAGLDPVAREHFLAFIVRLARQRAGASLVLVTHHVEEIHPCFTRALVLKDGCVRAAGGVPEVLTDAILSDAFGAPLRLESSPEGRFRLQLLRGSRKAF